MFGKTTTPTAPEPPATQAELKPSTVEESMIPLSVFGLDYPQPVSGWRVFLDDLGIRIRTDHVGRPAILAGDAHWLMIEKHDAEDRAREATARNDAEIEARRLASLSPGIPADQVGDLTPAMAMVAAGGPPEWEQQTKRRSVLEHALSHDEGLVFHPLGPSSSDAA